MSVKQGLPVVPFANQEEWRQWLDENHDTMDGVWIKLAKKNSGLPSVTQAEAVEVALCYGWIDGQAQSIDDSHWLLRFTPRRPQSKWSKVNRERAEALIEQGNMKPAGLQEVERAKADGRWDAAYDPPSRSKAPDDLLQKLEENPAAREFFENLDSRNRYAILHRIQTAKKPETRARRIDQIVEMLGKGEKLY